MTYDPPTPDTRRLIQPPNDESKMKKKFQQFNFGERRSVGVRQLLATPTALSSDCKWQEGGAEQVLW